MTTCVGLVLPVPVRARLPFSLPKLSNGGGRCPLELLLGTGLSWAREGLGAPGSAMLGCAGPPGLEAGRQVPAGLDRARLGCGEAQSRL